MVTLSETVLLDMIVSTCKTNEDAINFICDTVFEDWINLLENACKSSREQVPILTKTMEVLATKVLPGDRESSALTEKTVKILSVTCSNKKFVNVVTGTVLCLSKLQNKNDLLVNLLAHIQSLCQVVLDTLPKLGIDTLTNLIYTCTGVVASSLSTQNSAANLLEKYAHLQKRIEEISKQYCVNDETCQNKNEFSEDMEQQLHSFEPPEDFRELSVIPSLEELVNEMIPFLRPNKVIGPYKNANHYLDVHFRLLREDFFRPLRRSVQDFVRNRDDFIKNSEKNKANRQKESSVRVYTDVLFRGTENIAYNNTTHYIFVMPERFKRKVNWAKSKRLLPGCLVMLTADFCKTAIFAVTVVPPFDPRNRNASGNLDYTRKELAEGKLRLAIESGNCVLQKGRSYIMLECEAFFEAYRHTLANLQTLRYLTVEQPIAKFIVESCKDVKTPSYFRIKNVAKLSFYFENGENCLEDPLLPETWQSELIQKELSLDFDQYKALQSALTSELAVIQGPPGTGKTYVGLQIVKTILHNRKNGPIPQSPLLILCYTNHALDQFLELLLKEIPLLNVVRVGGQSKSKLVQAYNFAEHRKNAKALCGERYNRHEIIGVTPPLNYSHLVHSQAYNETNAMSRLRNLESSSQKLQAVIDEMSNPDGIFIFPEMFVGRRLRNIILSELWKKLSSTHWLDMESIDFSNPKFDVVQAISSKFYINPKAFSKLVNKNKIHDENQSRQNQAPIEQENFEYNLEELLEHRLLDIYSPWDSALSQGVHYHIRKIYAECCSVRKCKEEIASATTRFHQAYFRSVEHKITNRNFPQGCIYANLSESLKQEYNFVANLNIINNNKANFFKTLFRLYKQGSLVLRNVDNIICMTLHENESENEDNGDADSQYSSEYQISFGDCSNINCMSIWTVYFKLVEMAIYFAKQCKEEVDSKLPNAREEYKEQRQKLDVAILRNCDVIGMTTTGAAKMHDLLENAKPEIVIVEEAAEILEAHIVTSLTEQCKQLILIGDHLQLRPGANVYELWSKYRLNVSLFERMILNNIPYCTLKTQHRMRPEISDLIIGPIYEELYNHEKVSKYPDIKGVSKSMFFISHMKHEQQDTDLISKSNHHEAVFLLALCDYLLKQGYQSEHINNVHRPNVFIKAIRSTIVQSRENHFQGEENDIILLSLVRSNPAGQVGFVGIANRICVALSRARHGLFVIGNMDGMANASNTWTEIVKKLQTCESIGSQLDLVCQRHQMVTKAQCVNDFVPLVGGGCAQMCGFTLPCDHLCPYICHAKNQQHENYKCLQRCNKMCPLNHLCAAPCFAPCPPCQVPINRKLRCDHIMCVPCSMKPSDIKCLVRVVKTLPCEFNHNVELDCYLNINQVQCPVLVERLLPCDHYQMLECGLPLDQAKCPILVEKVLKCEHVAIVKCSRPVDLVNCCVKVEKPLLCGHKKIVKCYKSVSEVKCDMEVEIVMSRCFHVQNIICCNQSRHKCREKCAKLLSCGHPCRLTCHLNKDPNHKEYKCKFLCDRTCYAGHPCKFVHSCFKLCEPCEVPINVVLECGHEKEIECGERWKNPVCSKPVMKNFSCGHEQMVPCQVDADKQKCNFMIVNCQKHCDSGHECQSEHTCQESCPPCMQPVDKVLQCGHRFAAFCSENLEDYKCQENVHRECKSCNYVETIKCGDQLSDTELGRKCSHKEPDYIIDNNMHFDDKITEASDIPGSSKTAIIHSNVSFQVENENLFLKAGECQKECEQGHKCNSEHTSEEPCPPCLTRIEKALECGHPIVTFCSEDCSNFKCKEKIRANCRRCSAQWSAKCCELKSGLCENCENDDPEVNVTVKSVERRTRSASRARSAAKSRQKSKARKVSSGSKKTTKGKKN